MLKKAAFYRQNCNFGPIWVNITDINLSHDDCRIPLRVPSYQLNTSLSLLTDVLYPRDTRYLEPAGTLHVECTRTS